MAGKESSGKKENQKFKSLLVYFYLKSHTDEDHFVSGPELVGYLQENGIDAERRSIYTDIEQLNKVLYMMENDCSLEEAEEDLAEMDDLNKPVIYDKSKKGYRLIHSAYSFDDIRLLVESVYSAKFIDKRQSEAIIDVACGLVSEHQAEQLRHDVLNIDHAKTDNGEVFFNVTTINEAMSTLLDGKKHEPEKISFKYLRYSINDMSQSISRRGGEKYIVSPYRLIISDGNYYLRCFEDHSQEMRTFRIDRMSKLERLGLPRDGREAAAAEDYKTYTQRVFSMFGGEKTFVRLRFTSSLLDTIIDRFGREKGMYSKIDEHHFELFTSVEVSPPFFAWLCGFGTSVKIMDPPAVKEEYKKYLEKILKKL